MRLLSASLVDPASSHELVDVAQTTLTFLLVALHTRAERVSAISHQTMDAHHVRANRITKSLHKHGVLIHMRFVVPACTYLPELQRKELAGTQTHVLALNILIHRLMMPIIMIITIQCQSKRLSASQSFDAQVGLAALANGLMDICKHQCLRQHRKAYMQKHGRTCNSFCRTRSSCFQTSSSCACFAANAFSAVASATSLMMYSTWTESG